MWLRGIPLLLILTFNAYAQDSVYARKVIQYLTSKKCYGRGYLKNGLGTAANYILSELKANAVAPLFPSGYLQPFNFDVNTFPGKMSVKINGKALKPGVDYILSPESSGIKGSFILDKKDSVTYTATNKHSALNVSLKKKLTFSVATLAENYCTLQLVNKYKDITNAKVNIQNKVLKNFKNNNICGFIEGTEKSDSLIIFSAHYDHLGGLGKHTFFPGANDNASGVSFVLNLMRHYKINPPKYKTIFIFLRVRKPGLLVRVFL